MIIAVADYVEGNIDSPPQELVYALQADKYGILPNPGGLRQQPVGLMQKMTTCFNVWNAFSQYKNSNFDPKWIGKNTSLWNIVVEVEKMRSYKISNGE